MDIDTFKNVIGTVCSTSQDDGTEIGVKWDNGAHSHLLNCGKKGQYSIFYSQNLLNVDIKWIVMYW